MSSCEDKQHALLFVIISLLFILFSTGLEVTSGLPETDTTIVTNA